jgi:hypothetical protein
VELYGHREQRQNKSPENRLNYNSEIKPTSYSSLSQFQIRDIGMKQINTNASLKLPYRALVSRLISAGFFHRLRFGMILGTLVAYSWYSLSN